MKNVLASLALLALAGCFAQSAFANTVQVCSDSPIVASQTQAAGGYTETLQSAGLITGGACQSAPPPVPTSATCRQGAATDIPGVTLVCSGSFVRHAGGCNPLVTGGCPTVSGPFSFANVFGAWPGVYIANDQIFTLGLNQAISIPFTPSPGHSVSFFVNTTYTNAQQNVFSISTEPGLFNNGRANG